MMLKKHYVTRRKNVHTSPLSRSDQKVIYSRIRIHTYVDADEFVKNVTNCVCVMRLGVIVC
jgi:hypothetical protein